MLSSTLLLACAALARQEAAPPDWLGAWCATDGSNQALLLEPERAGWLRDDTPSFYRLHAKAGDLILEGWSQLTELRVQRDTVGNLQVEGDDLDTVFEPCDVPSALLIDPYDWPTDVELDADTIAALTADLAARRVEDQRVRHFKGQPSKEEMDEMRRVDADNVEFLTGVVEELGWIDAERFGAEASDAAFLIVQHCSDLRLMRTALPLIEADVKAGRLEGQTYALLFDRFRLNLGYLQRYGSQIGRSEQFGSVLMPCEDIEHIDARRAAMGMGPLAEYLDLFRATPEAPPPAHLTDVLGER